MRVTTPFRKIQFIKKAIQMIKKNPETTSLRSAQLFSHPIEKVFTSKNKYFRDYRGKLKMKTLINQVNILKKFINQMDMLIF